MFHLRLLENAIWEYEENTQSNFIIRQKSKDFDNDGTFIIIC